MMNKTFKGGNVLWVTVAIICLICAAALLALVLQEKTRRLEIEKMVLLLERSKRATEIKLDHAQLETAQAREHARLLAQETAQAKKLYQDLFSEVEDKDSQIKGLQLNLTNEKKQSTSLANDLAQLRENYDKLEERFEEARRRMGSIRDEVVRYDTKSGVKLRKIIVKPQQKLTGKVLVVNREFRFVVIDLGKKDRVKIGDEFIVFEDSEELARVKVEKVYQTMSTAAILAGSQENAIAEDNVIESF